jgi:hypothetical protein
VKLGDLFWRSALRNRAAREVEIPAGLDYKVIDIRDDPAYDAETGFLIPAGTDWQSGNGHVFGQIEAPWKKGIVWASYIEVGETSGDQIGLRLTGMTLNAGFAGGGPGDPGVHGFGGGTGFGLVWAETTDTADPQPIIAQLTTVDVTAADQNVIEARIAFLIF